MTLGYSLFYFMAIIILTWIAYYCYRLYSCYLEYLSFKKQGVVFNDKEGFSFFRDILNLKKCTSENPNDCPWLSW